MSKKAFAVPSSSIPNIILTRLKNKDLPLESSSIRGCQYSVRPNRQYQQKEPYFVKNT